MSRRAYPISLKVNGRQVTQVVIDSHYQERHRGSISDDLILELVKTLDGAEQLPTSVDDEGFEYYVTDKILLKEKRYKLIWLLHEKEIYIGIVNAYRRD